MNVKFKMPNFKRNLKVQGIAKELLMTVIGTTISIVLTFGTAHLVEQSQKRAAGRQTAMMAIHDLDEAVTELRRLARQEDENFKLASYLMNNIDRLGGIGQDTILTVQQFITKGEMHFSDATERTYLSSQDSWKNIDNAKFNDIMQYFYQSRKQCYDEFNNHYMWRQPLSQEEEYELLISSEGYDIDYAAVLSKKLLDKRVKAFIEFAPARQRRYNYVADAWQQLSNQAKFALGITDEEMKTFLKEKERHGEPLDLKDLPGLWVATQSADIETSFEFKKDKTMIYTVANYLANPFYSGRLTFTQKRQGTWLLVGDSLFLQFAKDFDYIVDDSQITCSPQMKDSVEGFVSHLRAQYEQVKKQVVEEGGTVEMRCAAFIDESGSKIELSRTRKDNDEEEEILEYLTRQENPK